MIRKTLQAAAVTVLLTVASTSANADWSIRTLETPDGFDNNIANDINDSGSIVGEWRSSTSGDFHSYMINPDGTLIDLNNFNSIGFNSLALGINNSGQVIGGGGQNSYITGPNGTGLTILGTLGGPSTGATSINDSGQVTGGSYLADNSTFRTFITGANGSGMTDIGALRPNEIFSLATGINNSGQVAGYSSDSAGNYHAFITGPNGENISEISGIPGYRYSMGIDVNNSGQFLGKSFDRNDYKDYSVPFISDSDGSNKTIIGTLGGAVSHASDINDLGQVIGSSLIDSNPDHGHAFMYTGGGMIDLSLLDVVTAAGWTEIIPTAINNNGQIVGFGKLSGDPGHIKSFLLSYTPDTALITKSAYIPDAPYFPITPIPEPSTYALLLAGLGVLGFMNYRNKTIRN